MNTSAPELPELSDASVDRIERAVFDSIAMKPAITTASNDDKARMKSRSRRRGWLTASGIAAAFVVGVMVTAPILNSTSQNTAGGALMATNGGSGAESAPMPLSDTMSKTEGLTLMDGPVEMAQDGTLQREMITSASATVRVDDIKKASEEVAAIAAKRGGFVESQNIGSSGLSATDASMPAPPTGDYGWISIRVPSADLNATIAELDGLGEVISSSTSASDVTTAAVDLRARIDAAEASVARLTELMAQTGTVAELIEAEIALTDRQAQLESYKQQLEQLESQVAMSSLQVELTRTTPVTKPDPAGFGDGFFAGWNGLLVSINALVIAVGFLLPWVAVGGVIFLIVWSIVRARRRSRAAKATQEPTPS